MITYMDIASQINTQISVGAKMNMGARNFVGGGSSSEFPHLPFLQFNVGRGNGNIVIVAYSNVTDSYSLALLNCRGFKISTKAKKENIFVQNLNQALIEMVNG